MSIGPANLKRDEILAYMSDINNMHNEFVRIQTDILAGIRRLAVIGGHLATLEDRIKMFVVEEIEGAGGPQPSRRQRRTRLEAPEGEAPSVPVLGKGRRACSNCRRPGHRATNCPNPKA